MILFSAARARQKESDDIINRTRLETAVLRRRGCVGGCVLRGVKTQSAVFGQLLLSVLEIRVADALFSKPLAPLYANEHVPPAANYLRSTHFNRWIRITGRRPIKTSEYIHNPK
jgi:hypothetical protein